MDKANKIIYKYIDPNTKENYMTITLMYHELFDGKCTFDEDGNFIVECPVDKDYYFRERIFNG